MTNHLRILAGSLVLLASIGASLYFFPRLPDRVPVHFDGKGMPNGWGSRKSAAALPPAVIAFLCAIYFLASVTTQNQKHWTRKLKKQVSAENLQKLMGRAMKVVDWTMIIIMLLILDVQIESFLVALGRRQHITTAIWPFMVVLYAGIAYHIVRLIFEQRAILKATGDNIPGSVGKNF